jgi:hypothetical protein
VNLGYAVTYLLRRLGIGLGILSVVTVGFAPLETTRLGEETRIDARLQDAVTERVRTLIDSTTAVEIRYDITELLETGAKRRRAVTKRISFDSLEERYTVSRIEEGRTASSETFGNSRFPEAEAALSSVTVTVRQEELVGVVVEASLRVPSVEDRSLVRGLWGGQEPTATIRFSE